jgi:uncharacterized protein DUF6627
MRHQLKLLLVTFLSVCMIVLGLAPLDGWAMLLPSTDTVQRQGDLSQIQAQLESKMVRERLTALNLTPQEVQTRMQNLTDDQIHNLAQNLDGLQVGGDPTLIAIAIIAGVVVLVLIIISAVTGTAHDVGHAAGEAADHHH